MIYSKTKRDHVTEETVVDNILATWPQTNLLFLKEQLGSDNRDMMFYSMIARAIRNDQTLWDRNHPLTHHWHNSPDERDIRDGIDFSADHPDAVSARLLDKLLERLNNA